MYNAQSPHIVSYIHQCYDYIAIYMVHTFLIVVLQDKGMVWADGTTLLYSHWTVPGQLHLPTKKRDCYAMGFHTMYGICDSINVSYAEHGISRLHPFLDNNTQLCAAVIYHMQKFVWIMIPCNQSVPSTLQICEQNLQSLDNNYLSTNDDIFYDYKLPHDYWFISDTHIFFLE